MNEVNGLEIAVIGMAGRFPGAVDVDELWCNLRDGVESISRFSEEELAAAGVPAVWINDPKYVPAAGVMAGEDLFDAAFFGITPRETEAMDPQHRVFLECAWEALESAGYVGECWDGLIGVYAGTAFNRYLVGHVLRNPETRRQLSGTQLEIGSDKDYLASRVAYKLNLAGPSIVVQSACSTSLVATHLACQGLLNGECDMALAGGVRISLPQRSGYLYVEDGLGSPDGRCRAFDARAGGIVGGSGVGLVVLKRLQDALTQGDTIRAVIRGSAVNNDGAARVGYTAPGIEGQAAVIRAALGVAEIDPQTIGYVEAHGSGTPLGDRIEVAALMEAFGDAGAKRAAPIPIGSVKTNLGHLGEAAGIAGLIKTILALEKGRIPPSLHCQEPNSQLCTADCGFEVNTSLRDWDSNGAPRRAGVSSFGLGGTNAHVVLEQAPELPPTGPSLPRQLLVLSARSGDELESVQSRLTEHLKSHPEADLADVAYTLRVGRKSFRYRRTALVRDTNDAIRALETGDPQRVQESVRDTSEWAIAWLFPGLGDHYVGMGTGLYRTLPSFREVFDECAELLRPEIGLDLRELLYTDSPELTAAGRDLRALLGRDPSPRWMEEDPLRSTALAQPALFAVEYSLARLWMSWGIEPQAMMGYSLGEYVAACLAGVFSLEDALRVVARRARLIEGLPPGAMLAVPLSAAELRTRLGEELSLAAVNTPELCVVAGAPDAVSELEERLSEEGCPWRRLRTSHAFHSKMMEPIGEAFHDALRAVELQPPRIPYVSNVTGTWIEPAQAMDPRFWVEHLLGTVRFSDGIAELWKEPERLHLEVGPGQALGSLALQMAPAREITPVVLATLRHEDDRQSDEAFLLQNLGRLWLAGVEIDAEAFYAAEKRRRIGLPTYPFARRRFWIEPQETPPADSAGRPSTGRIPDLSGWFYVPAWKSAVGTQSSPPSLTGSWLVFVDESGLGSKLAQRLEAAGGEVVSVSAGQELTRRDERHYVLDPRREEHYSALLEALGTIPERIVFLWSLATPPSATHEAFETAQAMGFYSLIALAQAFGQSRAGEPIEISVVADGLCGVERRDVVRPAQATLWGPIKVIPQEYTLWRCRVFDVELTDPHEELSERLAVELGREPRDPVVVWRGARRWVPDVEAVHLEAAAQAPVRLRDEGVYLITGGFGGLGLALADHLARTLRARLVLLGRSTWPPASEDPEHLAADDDTSRKIRRLRDLEELGAEVLALRADVTDEIDMRRAIRQAHERFGRLDGVFHLAGVPGAGLIQLKSRAAAASVLAPKVRGTRVLETVLEDVELDILVLFSSTASIVGGIGQVDYCAANAYLDACAHRQERRWPVVTIGWCAWQWDSWTRVIDTLDPGIREELDRNRQLYGLSFEEGMESLRRVLASGLPHVIVSTRALPRILAGQASMTTALDSLSRARQALARHARPVLGTPYAAPEGELELQVTQIWEELLGIERIGRHDNFFELGGHSLIGLQVLSRVKGACEVDLPLSIVFAAPTPAQMAAAIVEARRQPAASPVPEISRADHPDPRALLENLDTLSDEDVDSLLAEMLADEEEIAV